jgi:L-seryl-tRNA(Ser) seleniumtransferase
LRLLTRPVGDIAAQAERLKESLEQALGGDFVVETIDTKSQIGSGALPVESLESAGLAIRAAKSGRGSDARLRRLTDRLRTLPRPVIGAVHDGVLRLDLRCLDDEAGFVGQLVELNVS